MNDLSGPALRTFFSIARRWKLTDQEQMAVLNVGRQHLDHARAGRASEADAETIQRISHVLGIFRAINILLPVPDRADGWVRAANKAPTFGGRRPVDLIASGSLSDLQQVLRYLDAQQLDAEI